MKKDDLFYEIGNADDKYIRSAGDRLNVKEIKEKLACQ